MLTRKFGPYTRREQEPTCRFDGRQQKSQNEDDRRVRGHIPETATAGGLRNESCLGFQIEAKAS